LRDEEKVRCSFFHFGNPSSAAMLRLVHSHAKSIPTKVQKRWFLKQNRICRISWSGGDQNEFKTCIKINIPQTLLPVEFW